MLTLTCISEGELDATIRMVQLFKSRSGAYHVLANVTPEKAMPSAKDDLAKAVEFLQELFWVSKDKLKEICKHFQAELEDGLKADGRNISMNVTWVQGLPTGKETGSFLTIDLGGTNIRICWITLTGGKGEVDVKQDHYEVGDELKSGEADELWEFVAGSLEKFIKDQDLKGSEKEPLPLGFTFSYPAIQERIDHGVLQTWTKGFDIKGVEGEDVVAQLVKVMKNKVSIAEPLPTDD
jgi:hexokinase